MKSQPVRINSILRRSIRTALTLSLTLGSLASAAAFPINETFKTNSSANFTLGGTPNPAILTAGGVDPATDGWLRLTNNTGNQTGYAFYNPTFSSAQGVVVEFDYATWGGSGADGISFFLFDGTATSRIGAFGGSLGYAQKSAAFSGTGSAIPGVSKGYVGIGLDEFGNYSNAYEGRVGGFAGDVQHPSYVVIRGPGDGASTTDYPYLSAQPAGFNLSRNGGTARPSQTGVDFRHVRLIIQPDRKASVSVTNGFGAAPTNVINNFQLATTPPATYKLGFGASTGGATNYHELRNLVITAPTNLAITKTDGVSTLAQGGPVTYTVTVTNNGQSTVTGATMADTLPASINNVTWACVASVGSTCTDATGTGNSISAKSTLAVGGTATYTINGTLSATAALASTVTNTATVAAPAENTDSDLSDNTASDSDTVTAPLAADLSINKTGPSALVAGEVGSYILKVWNQGPTPTTGATIADAVPSNLTGVTWTCANSGLATCGTASGAGNAISFASGLLPVNTTTGAAGTTNAAPTTGDYLTITVTGTATTPGDVTNTATVTAPGGVSDSFAANNTSSRDIRITPLPFTPTTPAVCSTLPGFTGIGPNLVTAFNNGTFGTSTGDPLVAGSTVRSPTAWPYLPANIPNYSYVQVGGAQPQDGALSLVSRMADPRTFGVWSNTLTPITVNAAGAATSDVTSGRFLLINGSNQGQSIIETTITVTPNTNYQLIGIFANVIDSGGNQVLPNLNFNINGVSYYKTGTILQDNDGNTPTATNQAKWRRVGFVFNSGNTTSVTFAMVSNVPAANGNDFAFDQLGFNQCQGTYVNTLSGFVYGDSNANASFQNPAEPQLPAGVKVTLQYTDPNGNPVTVARTTTGVGADTGKYVFTNVPPPPTGFTYFVHVENGSVAGEPSTVPAGYTQSTPNNVALPGTPNYVSGTNAGPDFGFSVPAQPPIISLLKLGRNVTKNTAFIAGTGSVGVLPKDVVEYCLVYSNTGGAAPNFKITDNVPAGVDAQVGAYAAGNGIRWATGVTVAVGATATPAGVNLTSAADADQGTLSTTLGTNAKGVMTFDLGAAGLSAGGKGTVCFQTKVP